MDFSNNATVGASTTQTAVKHLVHETIATVLQAFLIADNN